MAFAIKATNRNHPIGPVEPGLARARQAYPASCSSLEQGSSDSNAERSTVGLP